MSLEDAINNHALALKELAAAIRTTGNFITSMPITGQATTTITALPADAPREVKGKKTETKAETKPDTAAEVVDQVSAEIETKGTVAAATNEGDVTGATDFSKAGDDAGSGDEVVLDYAKDVRPALLVAVKKGKRADIEGYLAKAGVAKAELIPVEGLPALLAFAQKLAA